MKKILVVTSDRITGLNYHRQLTPFNNLEDSYEIVYVPRLTLEEVENGYCDSFNMVSFLRAINLQNKTTDMCNRLKSKGIVVHFDIDDYWVLPVSHPQHKAFKEANASQQTIEALKNASFVTTTTEYLAKNIKQHNDNVYVLPNAINPNEKQWEIVDVPNELLRFGYIAGIHHVRDVEMLKTNIDKVYKDRDLYGRFQLCPAGFNLNIDGKGSASMNPYYKYVEMIFTDNYHFVKNKEYKEFLKLNIPDQNEKFNEPYKRLWGLDTFNYGKLYNFIDVSLVPLEPNLFSANKSELKLIEAGFMKKACIVSNVKPYDIVINDSNCIKVEQHRNKWDWYTSIRGLVKNPNKVKDLGEALYESVKDKYHINTVNVERKQIIDKWLQ